jgi:hypothetical protein
MVASGVARARLLVCKSGASHACPVSLSSLAGTYVEPVDGRSDCPSRAHPLWAHWNGELDQRYTLGIEEEVMLLDPDRWSLAQSSDQVLPRLSDDLSSHTSPETRGGG